MAVSRLPRPPVGALQTHFTNKLFLSPTLSNTCNFIQDDPYPSTATLKSKGEPGPEIPSIYQTLSKLASFCKFVAGLRRQIPPPRQKRIPARTHLTTHFAPTTY